MFVDAIVPSTMASLELFRRLMMSRSDVDSMRSHDALAFDEFIMAATSVILTAMGVEFGPRRAPYGQSQVRRLNTEAKALNSYTPLHQLCVELARPSVQVVGYTLHRHRPSCPGMDGPNCPASLPAEPLRELAGSQALPSCLRASARRGRDAGARRSSRIRHSSSLC